ncbi:TonB-dependent siderophore receptor [Gloeocapsa sp. PCC 7428]|uniref:TonB-dependent siderophore receptor n=1 Tax=Gloeocapsa sp. PCC 7428 TaxID=1173026 RepID=UPI0002A601F8|nr:TonB-dependent siderophore receptor [Gloeocapsa sp. PCC 7428]AFZ30440.1 TonB-dependent siderophore receptor [Gloeocapsa sp. PCC 7428]
MRNYWQRLALLTGISLLFSPPAWAQTVTGAATAVDQQQQIAQTVTQITGVRIDTTQGIAVVLETAGVLSPTTSTVDNTLIADIPNAVLALPEEFQAINPAEGIALVRVTNLPNNQVRVAITGTDAPPTVAVQAQAQQFIFSVTPTTDDETIEIIVTGEQAGYAVTESAAVTRTDTPLRDIPRSVQIIPEQVLEDQAVFRVTDAIRNVSGVVQDGGFGGTIDQLNIRGFSTEVFQDGQRTNNFGFFDTANVERVEVLKGPAAILFGNVEPGGIVNLVRKQPLAEPFAATELQVGSFGLFRPSIDVTGPLNEDRSVLYRLNVAYEHFDGFRDFEQDADRIFVAPALAWQINDATRLTFDFSYLRDERPMDRGFLAIGRDIIDIPVSRFLGEPNDVRRVQETTFGYRFEHQFTDNWTVRNRLQIISTDTFDYRAEPLELDEETGILSRNFRSNDDVSETYSIQTDVLGQFNTGSVAHNVLLGIDLNRSTFGGTQRRLPAGLTPDINIFDPVYNVIDRPSLDALTNTVRNGSDRTDRLGILLQDQVTLADNLKVLLAGRFDVVDQQSRDNLEATTSSRSDDAFSPTVGVVYQPIEPLSLYANFARSFQPNFGTRVDGSFLEPERGTQFEIGARGELLDGRLVANLALYQITKTNVATIDPNNPDFSIPIGEQRSRGIELDLIGQISPGWNVVASYALIDAAVTESNDLPEGSRIANVPENTASLWTTYELQSGDLRGLGFGLGLFYVGERAGDFEDTYDLPSYLRTDAAIFYRRDNWRAAINVQNLFDVTYFRGVNFGRVAIEPGAPLTVIGSLSVEF